MAKAIQSLRECVPNQLSSLARVAFNYRWAWSRTGPDLFRGIDAERWRRANENPIRFLIEARREVQRAALDSAIVTGAGELEREIEEDLARPYDERLTPPDRPIAYFCAEYGIHASLPIYAGGLGVLAGDVLKQASDSRLPFVAIGLLYQEGYFHQRLDISGWQHEYWQPSGVELLPCVRVTDDKGDALTIRVPFAEREICAYVWRVDVGRVALFLLDTDHPANCTIDRWITARLYVGDRQFRLAQYAVLGIGGVRALKAMGIQPGVVHLNEGHAALAVLELAREALSNDGNWDEALERARRLTVFTTHTPVAAGNEAYNSVEILRSLSAYLASLGRDPSSVLELGRLWPRDPNDGFRLTALALRTSRAANGVSRRHGHVARAMWQPLYGDRPVDAVPIHHVTNGVHLATWMAPAMRRLLDKYLGADWESRADDPSVWQGVEDIPARELWTVRNELRADLVRYVRERSTRDRLSRGDPIEYAEAAAQTFDADVLTVGFARRLATYKRLHLITSDRDRSLALLAGPRPLQVLIAGKAHPQDDEAKRIVQQHLFPLRAASIVGRRVCYLEDYDLSMALPLIRGCDVWVNLPRPPLEASGTSGMKAALNGGMNLSVLDGWWEEAFDGTNGWGIGGDVGANSAAQDAADGAALYFVLEQEIVPLFNDRDADGIPQRWVSRIKQSLRSLGPRYCAARMLADYGRTAYFTGLPRIHRHGP